VKKPRKKEQGNPKNKSLQENAVEATKQKEERGKNLSPRNGKACHSIITALMQSVAEIGTQMP
jgi:hypothetical protein